MQLHLIFFIELHPLVMVTLIIHILCTGAISLHKPVQPNIN